MRALESRDLQPERMDDPALAAPAHRAALRGLERINLVSGCVRTLWRPLERLARKGRTLKVLDLASGAGDVPIGLKLRADRAGIPLEVAGCDKSPVAVAYARERAALRGADVAFFECDAVRGEIPGGSYDVYSSSLFLHHLDERRATRFLRRMARGEALLVHDLVRSRAGLLAAYLGTRALSRSPVVHADGLASVRNAFTLPEVRDLAARAGLSGARIVPRWPFRFLMEWRRP